MQEIKISSFELRYTDYCIPGHLTETKIVAVMPIKLDESTWRVFYAYEVQQKPQNNMDRWFEHLKENKSR